jgi:hypothetical protein
MLLEVKWTLVEGLLETLAQDRESKRQTDWAE